MSVQIDRLVIDAPHLSEADGQRLAERVADGLRSQFPLQDTSARIGTLRVSVDSGDDLDGLTRSIVDELLRQVRS